MKPNVLHFREAGLLPWVGPAVSSHRCFSESFSASGAVVGPFLGWIGDTWQVRTLTAYLADARELPGAWVTRFHRELARLQGLSEGWDTYDALPPDRNAVAIASDYIDFLWDRRPRMLIPSRLAPSVDGSVVLSFLAEEVRANVEFYGTGEVFGAISKAGERPKIWEIRRSKEDWERAAVELANALTP